jgi:type IV pilus assembly protein PilM
MKKIYNHYFPTPTFLSMNSFALDISDQSVKYGELIATPKGLRLGQYGRESIPSGVVISGKIEDKEKLTLILKKIKEKTKSSFFRICLPEEQMYIFTIMLPVVAKNKIEETILLQIEDHIPLKANEVIFDYEIIEEKEDGIEVEITASSQETIEDYLSVLYKAQMNPLSFELESQAIARAVISYGDERPVMIVDFGNTRTGVTIVSKERVFLATTLSIGGVNLNNMIAKNFSLSQEEADKLKRSYGSNNQSENEDIFPAILNGLSVLKDELNKQCLYWESNRAKNTNQQKISRIILCGGDSNLAGLSEYLELSMKIKVFHANVWVNIFDIGEYLPEMTQKESLNYTTVLGLALADFPREKHKVINVLPKQDKRNIKKIYWARFISTLLNILSLMIILTIVLLFPSYFYSKTKESTADQKLALFNQENPSNEIQSLDQMIKDINKNMLFLKEATPKYQFSENILKEILTLKTEGITYTQISYNKKNADLTTLEIKGKAKDRTALKNFKTTLDNNPDYKKVELPISNFIEKENLDFIISIETI